MGPVQGCCCCRQRVVVDDGLCRLYLGGCVCETLRWQQGVVVDSSINNFYACKAECLLGNGVFTATGALERNNALQA